MCVRWLESLCLLCVLGGYRVSLSVVCVLGGYRVSLSVVCVLGGYRVSLSVVCVRWCCVERSIPTTSDGVWGTRR